MNIKNGSKLPKAKRPSLKSTDPETFGRVALSPLIEHCAATRGAKAEVVRLFNDGLAEPVRSTTIYRWLEQDEKNRIEPALGSGLRLLQVWHSLATGSAIGQVIRYGNLDYYLIPIPGGRS